MGAIVKTVSVVEMISALNGIFRDGGLDPESQPVLICSYPGTETLDFRIPVLNGTYQYKMPCEESGWNFFQRLIFFRDMVRCVKSFSCAGGRIEWFMEDEASQEDSIYCRLRFHGHVSTYRFPCRYILPSTPVDDKYVKEMVLHFRQGLIPVLDKLTRFLEESGIPQSEQKISFCPETGHISAIGQTEVLYLYFPEMVGNNSKLYFTLPSVSPFLKAVHRMTRFFREADYDSHIYILKKEGKPASYAFEMESGPWCWRAPVSSMRAPVWTTVRPTRDKLRLQLDLSQRGFNALRHFLTSIRGDKRFQQLELVSHGKRSFRIRTQGDGGFYAIVRADISFGREFRIVLPRSFLQRAVSLKQTSFQVWKTIPMITCRNGYGGNVYCFPS